MPWMNRRHSYIISAIGDYIGRGYLEPRSITMDASTRFDQLNFNIIDEAWVSDLVSETYLIDDPRFDPWPETLGDLLSAVEVMVGHAEDDHGGFADEDLVYISFAGGACGHALRYILLMSPDASGHVPDGVTCDPSDSGSLHGAVSISGVGLSLNAIPEGLGLDGSAWYDQPTNHNLVRHARSVINRNGAAARQRVPDGTWVWADHAPPSKARLIFPNARLLALHRNRSDLFRDFVIKNGMEPVDATGSVAMDTYARQRFGDAPMDRVKYREQMLHQLRWQVGMQDAICDDARRMGTHIVDVDRLLDGGAWRREYDDLLRHTGLSPDYGRVGEFLEKYRSRQYDRSRWMPSPDWNWVRLGPNIPGWW